MEIKFVNHSSFIVKHNGVSIIADPWLEGKVFNNGWDLLSKTRMSYDDFKDIDFIWFSHEHPDHFFPPNIKKIPAEYKKNITVLFQNSIDGRVAHYCRKAGFKDVIELDKGQYFELGPDFKVLCEHFTEGDSWICYKAGDLTILNTNDCGIRTSAEASYIKKIVGKVDILLTQFSYAYWVGNREDVEYRKQVAADKLKWMKFQCDVFEAAVVIPIASYIYFCHEENFYLNDHVNTAEKTYKFLKNNTNTQPVILYCGDEYHFMQEWNSTAAIEKYKNDFKEIELNKDRLAKNNIVSLDELKKQAEAFISNLKNTNNLLVKAFLKKTSVYLADHNKSFTLSLKDDLREVAVDYDNCDIAMSSESLLFCLKYPYGYDTTDISGRIQKPVNGKHSNFYSFFRIDHLKSRGHEMTFGYLFKIGMRKLMTKMGLKQ